MAEFTPEMQQLAQDAIASAVLKRLMGDMEPRVWASLGTTIATRPYENVKIDIGISGVPLDVSEEYLAKILTGANMTLEKVVDSLASEMGRRIANDFPNRGS